MHPVAALFRRHEWATHELVRYCASLDPALLERETRGTRGSIKTTLTHLVGTEQFQLGLLTGEVAADPIRRGERLDLAALEALADENASRWRAILEGSPDLDRLTWHEREGRRRGVIDWVVMVQCIHHGDEHRAHIGSVLGAAGVKSPPRLDGWAFGSRGDQHDGTFSGWADSLLRRFLSFSSWATSELLEHCLGLGEQALRATAPGTYGTVHETLTHLIDADGSYLNWLVGGPDTVLEGSADPDTLRRCAEQWQEGWRAYLEPSPDHARVVAASGGRRVPSWVLTLQAVHHANDHRAHVGTILGANGLPLRAADVWAYGEVKGAAPDSGSE
jgi:uncharacterized damage-inducible protein DinB